MKKKLFIFLFLFCCCQLSLAEEVERIHNTTIRVKLVDDDLNIGEVPLIQLQISAYPFGGIEFFRSKDLFYEQIAVKEGNVFNVPSCADIFYMHINYEGQRILGGSYYRIDNIYIIKAGSNLTIELDKQDVKFSGEGALIPNIQSQIIKHSYITSESDLKLLNDKEYLRYFQKMDKSRDSSLKLQLNVVESNKAILGEYYVKLLIANCYGYRYFNQLKRYDYELVQDEMFFKTFKKYYFDKIKYRILPQFTNEILEASPIFANYVIEELNALERLGHEKYGPMLPDSCIRNILQKINTNFNGVFKDKLLTIFALRTNKNENAALFFDEILYNVKIKKYKDLLISKIEVKESNVPFKKFNLEDESGKFYTLDSFKGKVVVLDFWFTGCENCAILNKVMRPIIKSFINNPQIKFVSISIDKDKRTWLNSVKTGNYTHHEGINLYTNGEGSNHDLIKYYNITSYPTVFVIKDGLMFSSLPPRPSLDIKLGEELSLDGLRLVELLEKAIKL